MARRRDARPYSPSTPPERYGEPNGQNGAPEETNGYTQEYVSGYAPEYQNGYTGGYAQDDGEEYDDGSVDYIDYSQSGFEMEDDADYDEELDDTNRFRVAMNVFDLISILVGLALILVLVALLISLVTWLEGDISQSLTLLTSNLQ